MDLFNRKKVKELENKVSELTSKLVTDNFIKQTKIMKEGLDKQREMLFKEANSTHEFPVNDFEKMQYEIDYPRKYNIGDKTKYGTVTGVEITIDKKFDYRTQKCIAGVRTYINHSISGRVYKFEKGEITSELKESLNKK